MMDGGAIGGYWATGRRRAATPPARVMTIESTAAKIGRRMKKCENMNPLRPRRGGVRPLPGGGLPPSTPGPAPARVVPLPRDGTHLAGQVRLRGLRRVLPLDLDLGPRPHPLRAADDDPLPL